MTRRRAATGRRAALAMVAGALGACQADPPGDLEEESIAYQAAANAVAVKWHPGHYMRFSKTDGQQNMITFLDHPHTRGLVIQLPWKDLEPVRDT